MLLGQSLAPTHASPLEPVSCCLRVATGKEAPPPPRLIFLLLRNLPKVWGHFLLHSALPKVQVLYLPLLIPFFLCPTALHGLLLPFLWSEVFCRVQ